MCSSDEDSFPWLDLEKGTSPKLGSLQKVSENQDDSDHSMDHVGSDRPRGRLAQEEQQQG